MHVRVRDRGHVDNLHYVMNIDLQVSTAGGKERSYLGPLRASYVPDPPRTQDKENYLNGWLMCMREAYTRVLNCVFQNISLTGAQAQALGVKGNGGP